jgi:hypothetical protein
MDTRVLKEMIAVIRAEQQRRASLLMKEDSDFANDRWLSTDGPLVNELCIMVLVTLSHQVERQLVRLAARADESGKEISGQEYEAKVREIRKGLRNRRGWDEIKVRLNVESCEGYTSTEALRFLVNSYKHNPSMEPDKELLKFLDLKTEVNYAPLPESPKLQEKLAVSIGLGKDADYCDIVERFVDIASGFLADMQNRTKLSPVRWDPVSLNPDTFSR